jgi:hypothetical protein
MARGLAQQKGIEAYFDQYLKDNAEAVGWEWATLWICHALVSEAGGVESANDFYEVLIKEWPRNYLTELCQGRMQRDFSGEYFVARDLMKYALALNPEGCEAMYQLGVLYDLIGVPEYAFAFAQRAYEVAEQFGEGAGNLKARISYNQAVAMWQAARPYGDIKAYLHRAIEDWPQYDRARQLLSDLPDNDELDPKGRNAMQRLSEDVRKSMAHPLYELDSEDGE